MASHCVQDNAQNSGNTATIKAIHGHGDTFAYHVRRINVIKKCDRISPSLCNPCGGITRVYFFIGIDSLSGSYGRDYPVFASLSGIRRNNDNYHVNYL
ncbi:hypothetical protein [Photorhabdus khanii]|uniref:hypothetical protein n=1 Tax=Photorhabdus khanii TaxID=1004150 RepID=UPI00104FC285|nr:hypothetical protein [Photorhabdus khanii]